MRRVFIVSVVVLFALVGPGAHAQLRVLKVDGDVQYHAGRRWTEARSGDIVPLESRIRVADGSGVVLTDDDVVLTLERPETFIIADVLAVGKMLASPVIRELVVDRAVEVASEIGRAVSRDEYDLVAEAVSRLDVRNAATFAEEFVDLVVRVGAEAGVDRRFGGSVVLFRALALLAEAAYAEALDTLHPLLDDDTISTAERQRAFVLSAISFRGIGHVGAAGEYLRYAAELDRNSSEGRVARELLAMFFSAE